MRDTVFVRDYNKKAYYEYKGKRLCPAEEEDTFGMLWFGLMGAQPNRIHHKYGVNSVPWEEGYYRFLCRKDDENNI